MRKFLASAAVLISSLAFADIVVKPDGSVSCTGECTAIISGGKVVFCQGKVCLEIQRPPKDDK